MKHRDIIRFALRMGINILPNIFDSRCFGITIKQVYGTAAAQLKGVVKLATLATGAHLPAFFSLSRRANPRSLQHSSSE